MRWSARFAEPVTLDLLISVFKTKVTTFDVVNTLGTFAKHLAGFNSDGTERSVEHDNVVDHGQNMGTILLDVGIFLDFCVFVDCTEINISEIEQKNILNT